MKMNLCRLMAAILCIVLLFSLAGCSGGGPTVMEYEGVRLTEDIYRFWLSCYKAQFSYDLTEENTDEIAALADENIKKSLVCVGLFNRYGLTLSDAVRTQIQAAMDHLVENVGDGDRKVLEEALSTYGIGYDGLKIAISYEQMAIALRDYLMTAGGVGAMTDADREDYYKSTYARVRMIYVSLVDFETDGEGLRLWDSASQSYIYHKKTGADLAAAEEKIAAVRAALAGGCDAASFAELVSSYNEDPAAKDYKNGFYFSKEINYSDYVSGVTEAALALEENAFCEWESDLGMHFIYRLPPDEGAWKKEMNADFFDGFEERARDFYFEWIISQETKNVAVMQEAKSKVDFAKIPANWEIYW